MNKIIKSVIWQKKISASIDEKCELELGDNKDYRSYSVSFKKIKDVMGFQTDYTIEDCAKEMYKQLKDEKLHDSIKTITLKWYNHIKSDPVLFKKFQINGKIL